MGLNPTNDNWLIFTQMEISIVLHINIIYIQVTEVRKFQIPFWVQAKPLDDDVPGVELLPPALARPCEKTPTPLRRR